MGHRQAWQESEARFCEYVEGLTSVIGHADRAAPLKGYCIGLLAAEGRRSVEPMAAVIAPAGVSAQHQQLLHFVANSAWSDAAMLAKVQEMVLPAIERHGAIEAWIIDDTSFPKQGKHSVGVHRQYCGQLGKQANCQAVVTLSVANHAASLPIAYRLYLPKEWTEDAARRKKARIPEEITFKPRHSCARADPSSVRGGGGARRRADGCRLRLPQRSAPWRERAGAQLRGRHRLDNQGASRDQGQAQQARSTAPERQTAGDEPAAARLAHGHMAPRHQRAARLALCPRARTHLAHPARQGARGGDAADRVAGRRGRAQPILALHSA